MQYKLERQTAEISTLSLGNVAKYEFLTDEDILPQKGLLEHPATIKTSGNSSSGSEL